MTTIEEYVRELGREELETIAKEKFTGMLKEVDLLLFKINQYSKREDNDGINRGVCRTKFEDLRDELIKLNLWDPKYSDDYIKARKGELEYKNGTS